MNSTLYALSVQDGSHFWNGTNHPPHSTAMDLNGCPAFRTPAAYHGKYDVVWSIEQPIAMQGWKILVDELVVLLKPKAKLVLKYIQNENISIPSLKHYLFRKYGLKVSLAYEVIEEGIFIAIFDIERIHADAQTQKGWTFGLLTQGKKIESVAQFCQTVREYGGDQHQIILCGPQNAAYTPYHVEYVDKEYSKIYGDISVKKNDIVALARHENLMLLHDRYYLNPDFFIGFDQYGYDFEFMTIRQYHQSGKIYPSFCAIADRGNLIWGQIIQTLNDKELWRQPYINGGLIIAKKHVLQAIPFNSMLFHNQAEDVELSRTVLNAGIIPKINLYSSAVTDVPDHLTNAFVNQHSSDYYSASVSSPNTPPVIADPPPPFIYAIDANTGWLERMLIRCSQVTNRILTARFIHRSSWKIIMRRSGGIVLRKCGLR